MTNGFNVEPYDRLVAVLDALASVSANESSLDVAIGLRVKPLQLVVATNNQIPCETLAKHLKTTCSILKELFDKKFSYSFPDAKITRGITQARPSGREVSRSLERFISSFIQVRV